MEQASAIADDEGAHVFPPRLVYPVIFGSNLTPGITRRPAPLLEHDNLRVGGRVRAVVGRRSVESISAGCRTLALNHHRLLRRHVNGGKPYLPLRGLDRHLDLWMATRRGRDVNYVTCPEGVSL